MRKYSWLVCGVVALSLAASSAVAAPKGGKKKAAEGGAKKARKERGDKRGDKRGALRGEYAILVKEVGLDEAQQEELKAKIKAQQEAQKAWRADPAKGGKLKQLKEDLKAAGKDKEKAASIKKEIAELMKESKGGDVDIESILRPDQKAKWEAFKLYRMVAGRLAKAELTDQQKAKIRELCAEAAKNPAGDKKAQAKATKALSKQAMGLLTDEQKAKLTAGRKPKDNPPAGKKPREKKPGNGGGKKKSGDE